MKKIFFLFLTLLAFAACTSTKIPAEQNNSNTDFLDEKTPRIGFYNVENLFDTADDPKIKDEDFTPNGELKWNEERYQKKLADLAKVISAMGKPAFLGLCEVENKRVVEDLAAKARGKSPYGVAHFDSPDERGIDVALMYQKNNFSVENVEKLEVALPKEVSPDYSVTRDILYVKGKFKNKYLLHIFVNHWPSRRDGQDKSEGRRMYAASVLKSKVNAILKADAKANVIIMGDFNDEPTDKSITETLSAKAAIADPAADLLNCMAAAKSEGQGTYNYRGNWNMLDQIIVSQAVTNGQGGITITNPMIFKRDWLIYKDKKYGDTPSRTYGGPNYYGGFSDHFPILATLQLK